MVLTLSHVCRVKIWNFSQMPCKALQRLNVLFLSYLTKKFFYPKSYTNNALSDAFSMSHFNRMCQNLFLFFQHILWHALECGE